METARCRAFLAAAETGSFSKAAEALSYTPSGVNQLVTALEKELGFPVFRRNTKGVTLTENGELLLPTVREFLRQEDRLFELATEINGLLIGSVTIAAYSSIATHWLPAVIRAFQKDYPHVSIRLMEGIWQEVSAWLDERTADIGFFSYQEGMPYEWIPLAEDPMLALLPPDHPLADARVYPMVNLSQERIVRLTEESNNEVSKIYESFKDLISSPLSTYCEVNDDYSVMAMVESGLGVSMLSELVTKRMPFNICLKEFDPPQYRDIGVAVKKGRRPSPATERFIEVVLEFFEDNKYKIPNQ